MDKKAIGLDQKKAERFKEWQGWLTDFLAFKNEGKDTTTFQPIPHAAELLNDYYWRLTWDYLKPLLDFTDEEEDHNLHYYKIISASELTVMAVLPITYVESNTKEAIKKVNAEFAWYVSLCIMLNWKINQQDIVEYESLEKIFLHQELIDINAEGINRTYPTNFRDEHIEWLSALKTSSPLPVLSNSHTWRLFYLAAKAIEGKGTLK